MRVIAKLGTVTFAVCLLLVGMTHASPLHKMASNADSLPELAVIKPKVRVKAPAFTLANINGTTFESKNGFSGKVVLLHFWATWCVPCRDEMPALGIIWEKFKERGFALLAVSADRGDSDVVRKFCDRLKVNFPVLLDPQGIVRNEYEVTALPTTYIIGKDGLIFGKVIGSAPWDGPVAEKLIETLLNSDQGK